LKRGINQKKVNDIMSSQYNAPKTSGLGSKASPVTPAKPATNASDAVSMPRVSFNHPVNRDLQPTGRVTDLSTGKPLVR
jgi:hypothetical protein